MANYSPRHTHTKNKGKKKLSLPAMLVIDVLLTGVALVIFALFHHVLPITLGDTEGTVITRPNDGMFMGSDVTLPSSGSSQSTAGNGSSAPAQTDDNKNTDTDTANNNDSDAANAEQDQPENTAGGDTSVSEGTDTETETDTDTETAPEQPTEPVGKFDHLFTTEPVYTEDSYSSPTIHVSMSTHTMEAGGKQITYYVADIYLKDIRSFQSYFAGNKFTRGAYAFDILQLDEESNAITAINGDYFSYQAGTCVLRNGVLYRYPTTDADLCVLNYDGTMVTYRAAELKSDEDIDAAIANAWQVWSFGPALLDKDGSVYEGIEDYTTLSPANPRTGIGYYEPGHYCFVVVDGRQQISAGARIEVFAQIFSDLGCVAAYNLDGGGSSRMTFNDELYSNPYEGRTLPDIILITEYDGSIAQAAIEAAAADGTEVSN